MGANGTSLRAITQTLGIVALIGAAMPAFAKDLEPAAPTAAAMTDQGVDKLKAAMKTIVDSGKRPGLVFAVARHGKLVALEAYGMRNLEKNLPMTTDSAFRLASLSRVLSGATIQTLLDDGKIKLTDPVSKFIPEFAKTEVVKSVDGDKVTLEPQKTPLTIRHLFTYTSGLNYGEGPKPLAFKQSEVLGIDMKLEDGIRNLAKHPLLYQPGAKWHYGYSGDVLGRVAEVASGQPLDQFLKSRMFDKIGMKDTGFWIKDADRLAEVYGPNKDTGKWENRSAGANNLSSFTKPGTMFSAGGGIVSTVPDYLRFAQMLLQGGQLDGVRVLKAETVKALLTRQTTPEQGLVYWYDPDRYAAFKGYAWGYAIGIRVNDTEHKVAGNLGDAGWAGFTNTWFFIDPKEDIAAVAMTQYLGPDDDAVVISTLRKGIYDALAPASGH